MAKFFVILALVSTAAAIDSIRYERDIGEYGGIGRLGYGNLGGSGLGINKQIGSLGNFNQIGLGYGNIGGITSLGFGGLGGYNSGYNSGIGVSKQISSVGGIGGLGVSKQINSYGSSIGHHHGIGGLGGVSRSSISSSVGVGHHGGIGSLSGIGSLGLGGISGISRVVPLSTLPGGYYGGLLAFPTSVGAPVTANELHIPGSAVDAYRGYFGGYYPGSIGYGQSYRFFH